MFTKSCQWCIRCIRGKHCASSASEDAGDESKAKKGGKFALPPPKPNRKADNSLASSCGIPSIKTEHNAPESPEISTTTDTEDPPSIGFQSKKNLSVTDNAEKNGMLRYKIIIIFNLKFEANFRYEKCDMAPICFVFFPLTISYTTLYF